MSPLTSCAWKTTRRAPTSESYNEPLAMHAGRDHGGKQSLYLWVRQAATSKGQSDGNRKRSPAFYCW